MKTGTPLLGPIVIAAMVIASVTATAQDKQANADKNAMMQKILEASTPGQAHKLLDGFVGTWDATTSIWMEGPDKPPAVSKGTTTFRWILGGRFLQEEATGEMMGQPYSGLGIIGYDNMNKKYTIVWVDNSSTATFTADGTADQGNKVFTFYGKMDEPITGEHGKTVKYVMRLAGKDNHVFEIYDLSRPDPNSRMVEISYTRAAR